LRLAEELGEARYRERARRAIEFLLSVQLDSGAFPAMEIAENRTKPSIFNSAQIVCGLLAWHKTSGDERVLGAMRRACDWIVGEQDPDGAWRKHLYGDITYTYSIERRQYSGQ
jgi:squalene cyclase